MKFNDKSLDKEQRANISSTRSSGSAISKNKARKGKIALASPILLPSTALVITEEERKVYVALKNMAIERICHSLDQHELAGVLNTSQSSISRRINLLRIQRLVTLIQTSNISNINGRKSYVVNVTPPTLKETLAIDSNYLVFLGENALSKNSRLKIMSADELLNCVLPLFTAELREGKESNLPLFSDELREISSNLPLFTAELRDIYNTARTQARTPRCISVGDNINTTSSGETKIGETNQTKQLPVETSAGGSDFTFLDNHPVIRELVFDLQAHYGKKAIHAITNLLKKKNYETKNGESFCWLCDEATASEMLTVLSADKPNHPIAYLLKLIQADKNGLFALKPSQQKLLTEVNRRIDPNYRLETLAKPQPKKTKLQKLWDWLYESEVKEFKPVQLYKGDKVMATGDIPFWKAKANDTTEIAEFDYLGDDASMSDLLFAQFKVPAIIHYDSLCKAIELGVIEIISEDAYVG